MFRYTPKSNYMLETGLGNGFQGTTQISLENRWRRDENYFAHLFKINSIKKKGVSFEEEYASVLKANNYFHTFFTLFVVNNIYIL